MTAVEGIMLVGYAVAALIAIGNLRAMTWLAVGAGTFLGSSAYWRTGWEHPELVAGGLDAAVCLGIYFAGRQRWEMWVWRFFQVMLMVNIIHLAGDIGIFHDTGQAPYAITLEAMNWLVILLIGGMSGLQRIGYDYGGVSGPWRGVRGVVRTLREERRTPPFTAAQK
jgi:hypothetical protein